MALLNTVVQERLLEVVALKVVGEESSLQSYVQAAENLHQRACQNGETGPRQVSDWQALYLQFTRPHVFGTVPYRWERGGYQTARLLEVTFQALDVVLVDGDFHNGSVGGAAKATAIKQTLGLELDMPLMYALGQQSKVALVRETEHEWELVVPHNLLDSLAYRERVVAEFRRHPHLPVTQTWRELAAPPEAEDEAEDGKFGPWKRFDESLEATASPAWILALSERAADRSQAAAMAADEQLAGAPDSSEP